MGSPGHKSSPNPNLDLSMQLATEDTAEDTSDVEMSTLVDNAEAPKTQALTVSLKDLIVT